MNIITLNLIFILIVLVGTRFQIIGFVGGWFVGFGFIVWSVLVVVGGVVGVVGWFVVFGGGFVCGFVEGGKGGVFVMGEGIVRLDPDWSFWKMD